MSVCVSETVINEASLAARWDLSNVTSPTFSPVLMRLYHVTFLSTSTPLV